MSIFRKPKPAHQLVGEQDDQERLRYRCSVCQRTFFSATSATWKDNLEWCPGKRCYTQWNWPNLYDPDRETIPAYLMRLDELKATGRTIRKRQEPLAYFTNELTRAYGGLHQRLPIEYTPLYDVRECIELEYAIALPKLV